MTPSVPFNPATIIGRLDPEDADAYLRHMRATHAGSDPYLIVECHRCYMFVLRWLAAGTVTVEELLGDRNHGGFTNLEWTTTELTDPTPGRPAGTGDILDTVDVDGQMLCSCGCGAPITDRSPSAYFASQECSLAWHEQQAGGAALPDDDEDDAEEPGEDDFWQAIIGGVRRAGQRFGAMLVGSAAPQQPRRDRDAPDLPAAASWLLTLHGRHLRHARIRSAGDGTVTVTLPGGEDIHEAALHPFLHRVHCLFCDTAATVATVYTGPADVPADLSATVQHCTGCGTPTGRPTTVAWVERLNTDLRLHLESGVARADRTVLLPHTAISAGPSRAAAERVRQAWTFIEQALTDFTAEYRADPVAAAPGDDVPYRFDVPEPQPGQFRPQWLWRGGGQR